MNENKIFLITLFFIFISSSVCSAAHDGIKISPTKTFLNLKTGVPQCTNIYFLPEGDTSIETRWAREKFDTSDKYLLSNSAIKLKINYSDEGSGEYVFCFEAKGKGYFYGIIFFQPENSLIKLGTWIELNVESESIVKKISLITGNAIKEEATTTNLTLVFIVLLLLVILLLFIKKL
jgi:hypothetical protein